jgi:AraC-like DNA-binding protein
MNARTVAAGNGWRADDIVCTAARGARPFEEAHGDFCVAAVISGTFGYRTTQGTALLAPGTLLLGNAGSGFECGHDHSDGDRCLSFHFSGDLMEQIIGHVPGATHCGFRTPAVPALPELSRLFAEAEAARDDGEAAGIEEIGLRVAAAALSTDAGGKPQPAPTPRDQRRVSEAVRLIEADPARPIELAALASGAATSTFHFLRIFGQITGQTPYQFVLARRLHLAAVRLRRTAEPVSAIAFDCGFNDLSTFNRRFKRMIGETPAAFRAGRGGRPAAFP